ncbi:MAG: carboxypeptidase regulatory-like domain-containing protein [Candidatus Hydrogenedentes bacterium]|nr:carboxypeptidase regulatory-like domain-containing protein [Candidatus Hydrogenedentota bacterium]
MYVLLAAAYVLPACAEPLSGTVVDARDQPVGGAVVYAVAAKHPFRVRNNTIMVGEAVPRALSERDGRFTLEADLASTVCLFAQDMEDACGYTLLEGNAPPYRIAIAAPAKTAVQVRRGPEPAPGENLIIAQSTGIPELAIAYEGKTNAQGLCRIPALAPGKYSFRTWEEVPQVGCCFRSVVTRAAEADIAPGSAPEITLGGTNLPTVKGRVASTDGEPLHGVWVRLLPKAPVEGTPVVHSAVTGRDGAYTIYDVPAGAYEVRGFRRLALNDSARTLEATAELNVEEGAPEATCDIAVDLAPFMPLEAGQDAPAIDAASLTGERVQLSDFKGKQVVIHFYAAWCAICVETIGSFDDIAKELGGSGEVAVLGISLDESEAEARTFVAEKGIQHPVIYAGPWAESEIRKAYRVVNIPTTVIVGPDGKISHIDLHGGVLQKYLREHMQARR